METGIRLLITELENLLGCQAEITAKGSTTTLCFTKKDSPAGITLTLAPGQDMRLVLLKTPRYYPMDNLGKQQLFKVLEAYTRGDKVAVDYISYDGQESTKDRLIDHELMPIAGAVSPERLEAIGRLMNTLGLINETDLDFLLESGGALRVHFWDSRLDYTITKPKAGSC